MRGTEGRSGLQEQRSTGAEQGRGEGCGRRAHLHHHDGLKQFVKLHKAALSNLKKLQTRCMMEDGEKAEVPEAEEAEAEERSGLAVVVRLGKAQWQSLESLECRPIFEPSTISSSSAATYPARSCEFVHVHTPHPSCQREDKKLVGHFQVLQAGRQTQV